MKIKPNMPMCIDGKSMSRICHVHWSNWGVTTYAVHIPINNCRYSIYQLLKQGKMIAASH
jgi:hypothetical protein